MGARDSTFSAHGDIAKTMPACGLNCREGRGTKQDDRRHGGTEMTKAANLEGFPMPLWATARAL
eukprot:4833233-Amphidinium_carterae.2